MLNRFACTNCCVVYDLDTQVSVLRIVNPTS